MLEVGKSCMMFLIRLEWNYNPYITTFIASLVTEGAGVGESESVHKLTLLPFSLSFLYNIWYFLLTVSLFPVVVLVVSSRGVMPLTEVTKGRIDVPAISIMRYRTKRKHKTESEGTEGRQSYLGISENCLRSSPQCLLFHPSSINQH